MSDKEQDDTWEDFFGTSPDLMPSIMGALDAILDGKDTSTSDSETKPTPRRVFQANKFSNLSPNVQKILSNLPDDEITSSQTDLTHQKRFSRCTNNNRSSQRHSPEKKLLQRSTESLDDIISPSVHKMLSNLPDNETVLCSEEKRTSVAGGTLSDDFGECNDSKCELQHSKSASSGFESSGDADCCFNGKPLGSYKQKSPSGIASRTPVGRKNMGKYLQIPSESTNSTSSEVSRPVSLTSLGSCSSSGSSGLHQQGSAYLASAESLDSDVEPTGSQGSADSGIAESTSSSPEARVLQEVLDTETVYVEDLRQVIHGYLEYWRNQSVPPQIHLHHLFSNIEEIYEFNRSFLEELRSTNFDPTATANVFLHNDSGFTVYTEYCTNYPRTMDILTELTRNEKTGMLFKQRQMSLGHALPLGSYLLKPVQRILKYHLLLQRLSKQCDSSHKPTVDLALSTMTSVANHINTMKRKHEHAVRVQEIQSQLYGWNGRDLTALGELIAEGTFRVDGARGRRHVFLFDKLLLMAKSKPDGALAYKTHIMCSNLMLVEQVRGEPLCFHVLPFDNPRLQCTLRARSVQQKKEWTLQIKRVILENYSAVIPNHARQLVMQLGQEVEETPEEQTEKWSPMKQHSTPQYLERRSRVRKTRDFTSRRAASQDRTFPSLGNWRRKSDPSGIQQYNTKTIPKKISKIKKAKECATVFYTDLSDSENCEAICASMDSLDVNLNHQEQCHKIYEDVESTKRTDEEIAQVVSDLLMQNEEFHKLINRRRRNLRDPESVANLWSKCDERLPSKSDSLPRSFQMKEKGVDVNVLIESNGLTVSESSTSLQDTISAHDDSQEIDHSHLEEDDDFPEHKIYRKSQIRFSLVQRLRTMLNEEQKKSKMPSYKQGSKSMGAKLANPDYADPQKLFANSPNSSDDKIEFDDLDMLDMTINETEVLKELDKRLSENAKEKVRVEEEEEHFVSISSQINSKSLTHINESVRISYARSSSEIINSSQNSDSYYESLLDKSLHEEEKKIEKSDSFRSARDIPVISENLKILKRPTKAPPPIPVKPKYFNQNSNSSVNNRVVLFNKKIESCGSTMNSEHFNQNCKGWVKTIVDRFE